MKLEHRYNIFKRTHKGLRSMLFNAGARIQETDFNKQRDAIHTIKIIKQTTLTFLYHVNNEDSIIYQEVVMYAPYIIAMIEQTNKKDVELAESINSFLEEYDTHKTRRERIAYGIQLQAKFFEFTAAVLQHINKEEMVINELLWSIYNDIQLAALEIDIMRQLTPDDCTWYSGNIMKGLNNEDIITWINGMVENCPQTMIEKFLRTARKVLPSTQWNMIREKFSGDKIAA